MCTSSQIWTHKRCTNLNSSIVLHPDPLLRYCMCLSLVISQPNPRSTPSNVHPDVEKVDEFCCLVGTAIAIDGCTVAINIANLSVSERSSYSLFRSSKSTLSLVAEVTFSIIYVFAALSCIPKKNVDKNRSRILIAGQK